MKSPIVCLIAIAMSSVALAQLPIPKDGCDGFCKSNGTVGNDPKSLPGIWYLTHAMPLGFSEASRCSYLEIFPEKDSKFQFKTVETTKDGEQRIAFGNMMLHDDGSASSEYTDLKLPLTGKTYFVSHDVVLVLFCTECGLYSEEGAGVYAYLYSKVLYSPCSTIDATFNLVSACGIKLSDLKEVEHSNCQSTCSK